MLKSNQKSNSPYKISLSKKIIYLDNASATPIDPFVLNAMHKVLKSNFANPGSIHDFGVKAKNILEEKREEVAKILDAHSDEIIFTSGATESNNLAILGTVARQNLTREGTMLPHIVTTNIEHPSVLETCKYLEKTGQAEVTYVGVEASGIVDPKKIKAALKENTVLVSVMYANNEIGTIQPIREITKEIRHYKKVKAGSFSNGLAGGGDPVKRGPEKNLLASLSFPLFHTDATQAINYLPIRVESLGIDLMSFNSGKIYGPKGVGVLYIKRKTPIGKIIHGGGQELGLRPGTENLGLIEGLVESLKITQKIKEKESERLVKLRDFFITEILKLKQQSQSFTINGDLKNRLPNNINISISKIPSDLFVLELSSRGIYISEKSACKSGEKAGSYVIQAIHGVKGKNLCSRNKVGSLRFSLGRQTTKSDILYVIKSLNSILTKLEKWYN
ncbi:MAG: cysteine desulfurase family protein [Candidatus Paceibacterota bacterium]